MNESRPFQDALDMLHNANKYLQCHDNDTLDKKLAARMIRKAVEVYDDYNNEKISLYDMFIKIKKIRNFYSMICNTTGMKTLAFNLFYVETIVKEGWYLL